jgi:succinate dehydrogenase hydrophobic anchor subunit
LVHPPLLQTIQVILHTLLEHIGSSLIITDYTRNTAYSSRTHWFIFDYYRLYKYHCLPFKNTLVHPPLLQTMQVTLLTFTNTLVHPPLLQTIQVTLLTLHEHIGSSPIITDYKSNTAYPSRTQWFIPHHYRLYRLHLLPFTNTLVHPPLLQTIQVILLTLHKHIGSSPIITDYTSNTVYPPRTH